MDYHSGVCHIYHHMNNGNIMKISRNGSSLSIVIPADVCRELHIDERHYFSVAVRDQNVLVLRRIEVVTQDEKLGV